MAESYRAAELGALHGGSTSGPLHFRRNHYAFPEVEPDGWTVEVAGAVENPLRLDRGALERFGVRADDVVLECAGHRRIELEPPVAGLPWGVGAVSQGRWSGAPLARILEAALPRADALEVVLVGGDGGGDDTFARAIPLDKARDDATLLAWTLDGAEIPLELGGPLRAVVPGHYAVDSVKWLRRIVVATEPFRGHFQENDYRYHGAERLPDGTPLRELPVTSLVTAPQDGASLRPGPVRIAGVAWGGVAIALVEVRVDEGPWRAATLAPALGPFAFTPWELEAELSAGPHILVARATNAAGNAQPDRPLWNARGYGNSSVHRIAVTAA
jgi:DMSO/TMAO reductase YedYZ molybdopterin-dependent catalytic subunit